MRKAIEQKQKQVDELAKLFSRFKTVGVIDLRDLPARQYNTIRKNLRSAVRIVFCKKSVIIRALEKSGMNKLIEYVQGIPALVLTDMDSFRLMKLIKKNYTPTYAKAGQIAPEDIVIKAGPTPFGPGPILSEFGNVGIPVKVVSGKITVMSDTTVVKKGEEISAPIANILLKLGIEPMKVGLNLVATIENGTLFKREVLDVDEEEFINKVYNAHLDAVKLAFGLSFPTRETVDMLIADAHAKARALAVSVPIVSKDTIRDVLVRACSQALMLKEV
ncbi:50S ribosomal protein L10 [Nanoarchaeota archaeon]|nr:MAG: 50S ribosomal protein L10 [Nanoarchaeota archaeon]